MTDLKEIVDYLLEDTFLDRADWPKYDLWLAQLVEGWVEERATVMRLVDRLQGIETVAYNIPALRDFNLIEERYAELKRRLGSSLQKE